VGPVIEFLIHSDDSLQEATCWALSAMRPYTFEPLMVLLKNDEEETRKRAISALEWDSRALEVLINALQDSCIYVRARAAQLLARAKSNEAIAPLIAALKDEDKYAENWVSTFSTNIIQDL